MLALIEVWISYRAKLKWAQKEGQGGARPKSNYAILLVAMRTLCAEDLKLRIILWYNTSDMKMREHVQTIRQQI